MNRDEAKQKLWATGSINTLSKVECDNLLNEVYDDFESESLVDNDLLPITYEAGRQAGKDSIKSEIAKQTCSSCKWYNGMNECEQLDAWDCMLDEPGLWTPPGRDFVCVLWESEDDR